ncbi:hypothetical protein Tco_1579956 [Tanacetum coccineum]
MASVCNCFLVDTGREGLPITLSNRWFFVHLLRCSNGWWLELEQQQQREEEVIQHLVAKSIHQTLVGRGYPSPSWLVEHKVLREKGFERVLN